MGSRASRGEVAHPEGGRRRLHRACPGLGGICEADAVRDPREGVGTRLQEIQVKQPKAFYFSRQTENQGATPVFKSWKDCRPAKGFGGGKRPRDSGRSIEVQEMQELPTVTAEGAFWGQGVPVARNE